VSLFDKYPLRVLLIAGAVMRAGAARAQATAVVVDGDLRLRRADVAEARRAGEPLPPAGATVARAALPGETIALQVVVIAGSAPVQATTLALADPVAPEGARLHADVFREHYLRVERRSRNDKTPAESLGWRPGARPSDAAMRGEVPDALLPITLDARHVAPPPAVPAGATGAFWVDVGVPDGAPPGRYTGDATLEGDGAVLARFTIAIEVRPTPLPYRATSVFIYYDAERLPLRMDGDSGAIERQLWQLLHAHSADALAPLLYAREVEQLSAAYDGSLFTARAGYRGAGAGRPPAVVAVGAYGMLKDPTPDALARAFAIVDRLPAGPETFLYAIDESCKSPRAADWQRALAAHPPPRPLAVGQTCDDPPGRQPVDIAMLSANNFRRDTTAEARASARRAFIYNGELPRTGTLLLDADPRGLIANGWIAATMAIERWFYWESIFWSDDNHGGHGPIDPFVTAESFHNADGDSALGDGLLLYPGRLGGRFARSSLGADAVLPSLRLKAIRRGIQDAGLIALAARERPDETAQLIARALPAALDEADLDRPASWDTAPLSFAEARDALRALVTRPAAMSDDEVRAAFEDLAARRRNLVPLAPFSFRARKRAIVKLAGAVAALVLLGFAARARRSRRRAR
jgi:hypothetical protein